MTSHIAHSFMPHPQRAHAGFTLVEIMVGLTIGMLASLVVMQVFSVFEAQKRATTGAADSTTNGSIALFKIGRDVNQAGYTLMPVSQTDSPLMCGTALNLVQPVEPISIDPAVAAIVTGISPIIITDGAAGASDSILIRYGDSLRGGAVSIIQGAPAVNPVTLRSNFGCVLGDITILIDNSGINCDISSVVAPAPLPPPAPVLGTPTPATLVSLNAITNPTITPATAQNGSLACLGGWHEVTYSVSAANILQRQDTGVPPALVEPTVDGIVSLQAQYGISANPSSNAVVQWVDAVNGQASGNWGNAMSRDERNRIKAVRIAVVARDAKMEPANVTNPCSSTTAPAPTGLCAWDATSVAPPIASPAPTFSLAAANANWQRYRYRVFETIFPIRSVIFAQPTLLP
ncbi:MAG: PilW family protein [Sideroxyarcus sp.]|nr:PilW family protein [Sideroxyarcus sp.]